MQAASASPTTGLARRWASFWPWGLVLLVGLVVLLPKLGQFGFWDPWEPRYAESAREMVERGSWIVPYYRGEVRLAKPILTYWSIIAGSLLFGFNEVGARLGGIVLALASMLGVYYAVALLRGRRAGLLSALVLGTLPQFYFLARQATPDVYLFTSLGLCVIFFCLALFGPERRRTAHFAVAYVAFALAVLAKGPIIPGIIFFVTLAIYGVARTDLERLLRPELRRAALRLALVAPVAAVLLAAGSTTAYLFATSSDWWGYSNKRRRVLGEIHDGLQALAVSSRLPELVLLLVLCACALGVAWLLRRCAARRWAMAAVLVVMGLAALGGLRLDEPAARIFVAAVLLAVTALVALVASAWPLVRSPQIWNAVRPHLSPLRRQVLLFLAINLLIAGPWYVSVFFKESQQFVNDFVIYNHLQRVTDDISGSGIADYYLRVLVFGFFPWSCLIPIALALLVPWSDRDAVERHGLELYLIIATAVTVVSFTAAVTKFAHYLAPVVVPIAVLVGLTLDRLLAESARLARLVWTLALVLYLPAAIDLVRRGGIKYLVGGFSIKRVVPPAAEPGTLFTVLLLLVALAFVGCALLRSRLAVAGLLLVAGLLAWHGNALFIPAASRHKSMKGLCETWKRYAGPGERVAYHGGELKHGVIYYCETEVRILKAAALEEFMAPDRPAVCIVERSRLPALRRSYRERYPGHDLRLVDDSHFQFGVVVNR